MNRAKQPGFYPDLIENALQTHRRKLALRSEQHANYSTLFVDHQQLHHLRSIDWQVIFGRRGTGKTFLLGVLHEEAMRELKEQRILSILLTAQDFTASPVGLEIGDRERGLGYFQQFIELLAHRLVRVIDQVLGEPRLLDSLAGKRRRTVDKIEELAIKVLELSQTGKSVAAWNQIRRSTRDRRSEHQAEKGQVQAGVKLGFTEHHAEVSMTGDIERRHEQSRQVTMEVDEVMVPRFAGIRDCIKELLEVLQLTRLNILIDEWSVLDPTAAKTIQTEFAELLKKTFAGNDKFSIKIATNRYQTSFDNRGSGSRYRGLELGADIFEATNLDRISLDLDELVEFYTKLLYRRLVYCEPELKVFDTQHRDAPDEQFILSMFKDRRAFEELVRGADHVPREFLEIFNTVAQSYRYSVRNLWTAARVQECIHRLSVSDKQARIDFRSEANQLLHQAVKPVTAKTNGSYFLVANEDRAMFASAIDELLEKRLIHEFPQAELPPPVRDRYAGFRLSYGVWLDWEKSPPSEDADLALPAFLNASDHRRYKIDTSSINRSFVRCPHCQSNFPSRARSYVVRKLCPECFVPVEEMVA